MVWGDLTTVIELKDETCAQFSKLAIDFIPNSLEYLSIWCKNGPNHRYFVPKWTEYIHTKHLYPQIGWRRPNKSGR